MIKNVVPKKWFGQNFLIDDNISQKIASSQGEGQTVFEIGPGKGALTKHLISNFQEVIVFEIDSDLISSLKERYPSVEIIQGDFLLADLETHKRNSAVLIANLPYNITTPILFKVLTEAPWMEKITVMVQKEVADRFLGKPRSKDYNALSVAMQFRMDVKKLFDVPSSAFYPAPKVRSTVIKLTRHSIYSTDDDKFFYKIVKQAFTNRRKTLLNNLLCFGDIRLSKEIWTTILLEGGFTQTTRAEELSVGDFIKLSNIILQHK